MRPKFWAVLVMVMAALALALAGCGDDDDDSGASADGDLSGTTVSIFGALVDNDAARFEESIAAFEEETGISIEYEGSGDFENLLRTRVDGGDPPDIALFPQPGLMADFVRGGSIVPLAGDALDNFNSNYNESWQTLGTVDETPVGVGYRANIKSLVWTPTPEFADAGYEVPETWDELIALTNQIRDDGGTPWCIGIESSGATGWVGTDWMEDIMLRLHGEEVYDQWVNHEIPFDDPRVVEAMEMMGEIWLTDGNVLGGKNNILTVPFGDAPTPLFNEPPQCFMHRQASFITGFFPDDVQESLGGDEPQTQPFYLPPINDEFPSPVLGAGDIAAAFSDRPEVQAVMAFLATPESGTEWAKAGGYLSPHEGFDSSLLPTEAERTAADILANASAFRFDASDLMPGEVGTGTFWTAVVDYVNGDSAEQVLGEVEASWPSG